MVTSGPDVNSCCKALCLVWSAVIQSSFEDTDPGELQAAVKGKQSIKAAVTIAAVNRIC